MSEFAVHLPTVAKTYEKGALVSPRTSTDQCRIDEDWCPAAALRWPLGVDAFSRQDGHFRLAVGDVLVLKNLRGDVVKRAEIVGINLATKEQHRTADFHTIGMDKSGGLVIGQQDAEEQCPVWLIRFDPISRALSA